MFHFLGVITTRSRRLFFPYNRYSATTVVGEAGIATQTRAPSGGMFNFDSIRECKEQQSNRTDWSCATTADYTAFSGNDALLRAWGRDSGCDGQALVDSSATMPLPTAPIERPPLPNGSLPLGPFTTLGRVDQTLWNNGEIIGATTPYSVEQPCSATTTRIEACSSDTIIGDTAKAGSQHVLAGPRREYLSGGSFDFGSALLSQPKQLPAVGWALNSTTARHTNTGNGGSTPVHQSTFEYLLGIEDAKGVAPSISRGPPGRYAEHKQQGAPTMWDSTWAAEGGTPRIEEVTVQPLQIVRARGFSHIRYTLCSKRVVYAE